MDRKRIYKLFVVTAVILACFKMGNNRREGTLLAVNGETRALLEIQDGFVKVAEVLKPTVVNISSIQKVEASEQEFYFGDPFDFFRDFPNIPGTRKPQNRQKRYYKAEGTGSGFIISRDGYILTNEHVIHGADEITVRVLINNSEKSFKGRVIGKDSRADLAVIKINEKNLPVVVMGDSDKIRVGQWVIAIGSPFGLEQTVTSGIVSAQRQSLVIEGKTYKDFIQTDAAINKGNSGGPLCNINGEVIGINTAIYAPTGVFSGVGFAIPINRAKDILDELIHKGKVVRGWLGVEIKPVDEAIKKQFGLPGTGGALINNVMEKTPASKYGLKRGDVITGFNGKEIKSPQELQNAVSVTEPNKKARVEVFRDGKKQVVEIVMGEMPSDEEVAQKEEKNEPSKNEPVSWLDMTVSNLTDDLREKYQVGADETGVVVIDVSPQGKAQEIGLQEGDLIKSINRAQVTDLKKFNEVSRKLKLAEGVVFDILRQGVPLYLSYSSNE